MAGISSWRAMNVRFNTGGSVLQGGMNEVDRAGAGHMDGSGKPCKCVGDALLFGRVGEYTIATVVVESWS